MNDALIQAITVFLPTGYLVATLLYGMAFAGERAPNVERVRPHLVRLLLVLHAALLVLHGIAVGGFPVINTWLSVSAVALAMVGLFVLGTRRRDEATVGALVLLAVGLLQLIASMFGPTTAQVSDQPSSAATGTHVVTAAVAVAALILSGIYGFLYLTLLRQMKKHAFGPIFRQLPDLTQLARMTRSSALAGFLGLTLGVNVGIGIAHANGTAGFHYTDPIVILALVLWLHFGVIAFSGKIRGVTAQRASFAAVAGLGVLVAMLLLAVTGATFHTFS